MRPVIAALAALWPLLAPTDAVEDFEEIPAPDEIYDGWERVVSDAHPPYNEIAVVHDPAAARSGNQSLRLRTQGGRTSFRMLPRRAWKVEVDRPYRFTAWARLQGTKRNGASATIVWLDERLEAIGESTGPMLTRDDEWTELPLEIPRAPDGARWAAVRLNFEGPDVRGTCAFDLLTFARSVQFQVRPAGRELPIYASEEPVRFDVSTIGVEGDHSITVTLRHQGGAEIRRTARLRGPHEAAATLEFPRSDAGLYRATAEMTGAPARRSFTLLVTNPWISPREAVPPFGAAFNPIARDYRSPDQVLAAGGFRRAKVVLGDDPPPARGAPPGEEQIFDFLRRLTQARGLEQITGVLAKPSRDLRATVARHRELVPFWQQGPDPAGAVATDRLGTADPGVRSRTIPAGSPDALVRRMIAEASSPSGEPAYVPIDDRVLDPEGYPLGTLLALRAANDLLAGAVPRRDLRLLEPPVREAAFDKGGRTLLALWTDGEEIERDLNFGPDALLYPPLGAVRPLRAGERLRLGPMPLFVVNADTFFLEAQASLEILDPADPARPNYALPLRSDPTPRLLRFRNLSWEKELTDIRIRLEAPLPAGWLVRPLSVTHAQLGRGQSFTRDLLMTLPPEEIEREQQLRFEIAFVRDGREHVIRASRTLRIASPIRIVHEVSDVAGKPGAKKVILRVANASERAVSLLLRVRLPNLAEQTEPLGRLEPGAEARPLSYVVPDAHLVDPSRLVAEVIGEENGGSGLHIRRLLPLRP